MGSETAGMSATRRDSTLLQGIVTFGEVTFHTMVRSLRNESGGAALGILLIILRSVAMIVVFLLVMNLMGAGGARIRGDAVLYIYSGVALFLLHNGAVSRTVSAGSPLLPIMRHTPMTTMLNVFAANCALLYTHVVSTGVILAYVHLWRGTLEIAAPKGMILPFLLAWASGIAIGLMLLTIKPFLPQVAEMVSLVYRRVNLISSGKFFVANTVPATLLAMFTWNPLFHCIDQLRGAIFVNYFPRNTSLDYPVQFVAIALVLGLMAEFWLRRNVSLSTTKRQ